MMMMKKKKKKKKMMMKNYYYEDHKKEKKSKNALKVPQQTNHMIQPVQGTQNDWKTMTWI